MVQFDVKTAFLNGDLDEEIFMEAPKGLDIEEKKHSLPAQKELVWIKTSIQSLEQKIHEVPQRI